MPNEEISMTAVVLMPGVISFRSAGLGHSAPWSRPATPRASPEFGSDLVLTTHTPTVCGNLGRSSHRPASAAFYSFGLHRYRLVRRHSACVEGLED